MNSLIRGWLRETATDPVPWELPIKENGYTAIKILGVFTLPNDYFPISLDKGAYFTKLILGG